ncbi:hypothetical protein ACIQNU_32345 [Streptomyces sp. NPDC091292]|uniref:hypothetical protein n=1 Tax=Streptomyces sp. NPDC091292 TaxID=3365991 RepID=UPI00380EFCF7
MAAHSHALYPSGDFMFPSRAFDVMEVWNGLWTSDRPWNADSEAALAESGQSLAVDMAHGLVAVGDGNSDTHLEGQIGIPHTVVFAEELSTEAVLAGIRAGRSRNAVSADADVTAKDSAFVRLFHRTQATEAGDAEVQFEQALMEVGASFVPGSGAIQR